MKRVSILTAIILLWSGLSLAATMRRAESPITAAALQHKLVRTGRRSLPQSRLQSRPHSAIAALSAGAPLSGISFLAGNSIDAGGVAHYADVTGDFNGDGKTDAASIVSPDESSFFVSVLLSNGDGTFAAPVLTAINFDGEERLCAADLNGDGRSDLILVHATSLDVFLSNGDGTFAAPVNYSDNLDSVAAVFAGDVNSDSKIDIVVASGVPLQGTPNPTVATLLGNGNGTLQAPSLAAFPAAIPNGVFADVNGDGKLDVVTALQVFLAQSGGYQSGASLVSQNNSTPCTGMNGSIAVADLNGDSQPDIATADCANNTVTVYLNSGSGNFQQGTSYWAGDDPEGVNIVDTNNDGIPDILSANSNSSDVTVLLGKGDGTFQTPQIGYSVGGYPGQSPAVADFNGDGTADALVGNFGLDPSFAATFLPGASAGGFVAARDYFSPALPAGSPAFGLGIASADFNGDNRPDFVLGNAGPSGVGVTVFLANSDGTLKPGVNYGTTGSFNFVATGDFNSDGKQDIITSDAYTGDVNLFPGNGDGTFQAPQIISVPSYGAAGLVAGDFNKDGYTDIAVLEFPAAVAVLLNDGVGGFQSPVLYNLNGSVVSMTMADINGDGNLDLLMPQFSGNTVSVLLGRADGTFQSAADIALGFNYPSRIAVGDFNGDGKQDMAVTINDSAAMGVAIALGNGDGTFQTAVLDNSTSHNLGPLNQPSPTGVQAVDVDNDGKLDLVVANSSIGTISTMFGKGDGTFYSPVEVPAGALTYDLSTADVNGDGTPDVVASGAAFSGVTVLLNAHGPTPTPTFSMAVTPASATLSAGQSASFAVTITPANGYNGNIVFSCATLPQNVTCQFSPASITPSGVPVQVQLTVTNTASALAANTNQHHSNPALMASLSSGFFGLVLLEGTSKRQRRLALVALMLVVLIALVGCGGGATSSSSGSGSGPSHYEPPPTSHIIQVVATGTSSSGSIIQQTNITIDLQ
jgi:hypothetical protein